MEQSKANKISNLSQERERFSFVYNGLHFQMRGVQYPILLRGNMGFSLAKNKTKEMDMIHGPLLGKIILFTIPVMLSGVLQLLFNAADIVVVGRFAGDASLAAVGSTSSLINLLTNLGIGFSIGTNVTAAHFYGSGERDRVRDTAHTSITLSLICGAIIMTVGLIGARVMLGWMGNPEDVIGLATVYLRIYFLGIPGMMLYNFGAALLRASGDTQRPLYFLMISGVINVVLNLLMVVKFSLGVVGVGVATVVAQYVSAILVLVCLIRDNGAISLSLRELHIDKKILARIVKVGLPAGIQGSVFSLSNVVIQSAINSFGSMVVAGNSAAGNIEGFVWTAMNSWYQAAITFCGQNYGAGEKKRILKVMFICEACVIAVGLVFGNAVSAFSAQLLHIYTKSPEVVAVGQVRLFYVCTFYCICGMMDTMVGALRGIGKSIGPMIISLTGACGLRLIWIATIFQFRHTPDMLYITYPVSWSVTFIVQAICFVIAFRKLNFDRN